MATPLLKTKLYIPPVRLGLVSRPHLIERLDQGIRSGCKLILVSAPAGFGKTTLLSEWVHQTDQPTAWLSLDDSDNDPTRFWSYAVAALQTVYPGIGEAILTVLRAPRPQPLPIEALLTDLINEIVAAGSAPLFLVLDDLHVVTTPQIHEGITFLLEHLPPHVHLILATRADPPWPLARLRARGEMTELRTVDLRFTLKEVTAFVNDVMGLNLSGADIATLDARAEGWIAGLQMAALSMQGRTDTAGFLRAFGGSHRYVLDYLTEEVLARQADNVQTFLLQTSILERITAPLCDAIMSAADPAQSDWNSQATLAQLDRANLFLIPMDDERRWYRYHHLFADLLRGQVRRTQPDLEPVLRRRASEWHEGQGLIAEAVSYALAAGDVERVARLVEGNAFAMIEYGELGTLLGWLHALPRQAVHDRPWLCIAYAWALVYAGQIEQAGSLLENARDGLEELAPDDAREASGHIAAIRAYGMWVKGGSPKAVEHAREALERLSDRHLIARSLAATVLGGSLIECADLAAAERALSQAVETARAAGDAHTLLQAVSFLAGLFIEQGRLRRAAALCRDALDLSDDYATRGGAPLPAAGNTYGVLSEVLCEWNELEAAVRVGREGVALGRQWGQADTMTFCSKQLALVLAEAGDVNGALEAIEEAKHVAGRVSRWFDAIVAMVEAKVYLSCGNIAAAVRWAEGRGARPDDQNLVQDRQTDALLSRLLIAQGRLDEATQLLERLVRQCEEIGATGDLVHALVQCAIALEAQGKIGQALAPLQRALSLAAPEGYVRTFIREGAPMDRLLSQILDAARQGRQATAQGSTADYASKLLVALRNEMGNASIRGRTAEPPHPPLVEPLSARELEVLQILRTSLSMRDIASELHVSVNTVRSHVKHIYAKLNVHSRAEAVDRAEELGLL